MPHKIWIPTYVDLPNQSQLIPIYAQPLLAEELQRYTSKDIDPPNVGPLIGTGLVVPAAKAFKKLRFWLTHLNVGSSSINQLGLNCSIASRQKIDGTSGELGLFLALLLHQVPLPKHLIVTGALGVTPHDSSVYPVDRIAEKLECILNSYQSPSSESLNGLPTVVWMPRFTASESQQQGQTVESLPQWQKLLQVGIELQIIDSLDQVPDLLHQSLGLSKPQLRQIFKPQRAYGRWALSAALLFGLMFGYQQRDVWLQWPWVEERLPLPSAQPNAFSTALVHIEGDDSQHTIEQAIRGILSESCLIADFSQLATIIDKASDTKPNCLDLMSLPRTLYFPAAETPKQQLVLARNQVKAWLDESQAQLLVWAQLKPNEAGKQSVRLFITARNPPPSKQVTEEVIDFTVESLRSEGPSLAKTAIKQHILNTLVDLVAQAPVESLNPSSRLALAEALWRQGLKLQNPRVLEQSIAISQQALKQLDEASQPQLWLYAQYNLSAALAMAGRFQGNLEQAKEGLAIAQAVLPKFSQELQPLRWADMQAVLGFALYERAAQENNISNRQAALKAFQAELALRDARQQPHEWAISQINVAITLADIGNQNANTQQLNQALNECQKAEQQINRAQYPLDWASSQVCLGMVYNYLASAKKNPSYRQMAIAAFQNAQHELSQEKAPMQWIDAQFGVAATWAAIALQDKDKAKDKTLNATEQGIVAFKELFVTLQTNPNPRKQEYTQMLLGLLHFAKALSYGPPNAKESRAAFQQALAYFEVAKASEAFKLLSPDAQKQLNHSIAMCNDGLETIERYRQSSELKRLENQTPKIKVLNKTQSQDSEALETHRVHEDNGTVTAKNPSHNTEIKDISVTYPEGKKFSAQSAEIDLTMENGARASTKNKQYDSNIKEFNVLLPDGTTFSGEMENGKLRGKGQLTFPDGKRLIGSFKEHGQPEDGPALLIFPSGKQKEVVFENGKIIK